MIKVTRFNGNEYYINPHLIESIESNPDTTISLFPSRKIIVKDSTLDIIDRIRTYRRSIGISISDAEINQFVLGGGNFNES